MDLQLLSSLVALKCTGVWIPQNVPPTSALMTAQGIVNGEFGTNLQLDYVRKRVAQLERRYNTFRQLVNLPQTHWSPDDNIVLTDDRMWKSTIKNDTFAKAYYYKGEPEFNLLASIFGTDEMKNENEPPVINISEDFVRTWSPKHVTIVDSDSEEVTSPVMRSHATWGRPWSEAESTRAIDQMSTTFNSWGNFGYPTRNAFPPPPVDQQRSSEDDGDSSCASSDPHYRKENPFW